ncbi:MAG: alpha/beta fold hydrolase [Verrucomicrobiota bacterium]|nr:alpha/beta fold hydrolase [Verrucomicrobiota bacterium]
MILLVSTCAVTAAAFLASRIAPYAPKPLRQALHWIHAATFEFFAVILSLCLRFLNPLFSKSTPQVAQGVPILMIHGYLHNSSAWVFFRKFFSRLQASSGIGPLYTIDLPLFQSIPDDASLILQRREEIFQETGRRELILIGHSMGGLVALFHALHLAKEKTWVITLGSPLHGTHLARIALGPNGKEMRRGSLFVKGLEKSLATSNLSCYHLGSETDQVVVPASSAFMGRFPDREFHLPNLGHMSLLFSRRVMRQVLYWIETFSP